MSINPNVIISISFGKQCKINDTFKFETLSCRQINHFYLLTLFHKNPRSLLLFFCFDNSFQKLTHV